MVLLSFSIAFHPFSLAALHTEPCGLQELTSPEQLVQTQNERSLYAQPFPYDTTLEDLASIFSKHGQVRFMHDVAAVPAWSCLGLFLRCILSLGQFHTGHVCEDEASSHQQGLQGLHFCGVC